MPEQTTTALSEAEVRADHLIRAINELEDAGRWSDATRAREALAVSTETRDTSRLRLMVATQVVATRTRFPPGRSFGSFAERRS